MVTPSLHKPLRLDRDGAQLFESALDVDDLSRLMDDLADIPVDKPGVRLGAGQLPALQKSQAIAVSAIGSKASAVRAILFDKSPVANWNLGWHQDRTIVVRGRVDVPGFGPWSVKGGLQHVEPPFDVIESMVTLRLHLDPVDSDNAPLMIAPGSHRLGKIAVEAIADKVSTLGTAACHARAGDIWLYSTPILHASEPAARPRRRRVLQIDYAAQDLPGGLAWLGV